MVRDCIAEQWCGHIYSWAQNQSKYSAKKCKEEILSHCQWNICYLRLIARQTADWGVQATVHQCQSNTQKDNSCHLKSEIRSNLDITPGRFTIASGYVVCAGLSFKQQAFCTVYHLINSITAVNDGTKNDNWCCFIVALFFILNTLLVIFYQIYWKACDQRKEFKGHGRNIHSLDPRYINILTGWLFLISVFLDLCPSIVGISIVCFKETSSFLH